MKITDAIVEAATDAAFWKSEECDMRAAIAAVAPLIAQEAAQEIAALRAALADVLPSLEHWMKRGRPEWDGSAEPNSPLERARQAAT